MFSTDDGRVIVYKDDAASTLRVLQPRQLGKHGLNMTAPASLDIDRHMTQFIAEDASGDLKGSIDIKEGLPRRGRSQRGRRLNSRAG